MNMIESKTNLNCDLDPAGIKNYSSPEKTEQDLPVGILMGAAGTGKTSLLNKLCKINSETGWSPVSDPRKLSKIPNTIGESSFELIDTPGIESQEETYKHAVLLNEALTFCKVNTIFVFVKYDNRHARIVESFFKVLTPVNQYESKIVAVISHWDLSTNPEEEKESIRTKLSQDIAGVIFYSWSDNPEEVANSISSFLEKMPREKLKIPNQEFSMNFNFPHSVNSIIKDERKYHKNPSRLEDELENYERTERRTEKKNMKLSEKKNTPRASSYRDSKNGNCVEFCALI